LSLSKDKLIVYLDLGILISYGIHVISSQWYIAVSSIGQGIMLGLLIIRLFSDRNIYKAENFIYAVFIIYIISDLISTVFSINPANSLMNSKRVLLFAGFFVTYTFIKDIKLRYFLLAFLIFSALLSTYEIIRYIIEYHIAKENAAFIDPRLQYFGYPITNGEIKMLILLLIVPFFFIKENFVAKKHWLILFLLPVLITLFMTASRNAMLGLLGGVVVISFVKNKKFLLVFIALVILFVIFVPHPLKDRIMSIGDLNFPSNKSRIIMWETGLRIIKDYFFLGIGDTDLLPLYKTYKIPEFSGEGIHMHNNFMQAFVSFGIIGFVIWLTMMGYILFKQIKIFLLTKKNKILNTLALSSIACMVAFQISGLTEYNFGDYEFAAVLWFTLGLSYLTQKFYIQDA
jgi:putative inorganic carbon (hco3(-)) transporter